MVVLPTAPNDDQGADYNTSFGGIVKVIKFNPKTIKLRPLSLEDSKIGSSFKHVRKLSFTFSNQQVQELGQSFGTALTVQNNVYVEDPLNGTPGSTITLHAMVSHPVDLTTGVIADGSQS